MPSSIPESTPEQLDLENKLVNPSLELFESLKSYSSGLYQSTRETLFDAHANVAVLGKQFYDQPVETTTEWYGQATALGSETLGVINNEFIPELRTFYAIGIRNLQNIETNVSGTFNTLGKATTDFSLALYNNPTETLQQIYSHLQTGMSGLSDYSVELFNQTVNAINLTYHSTMAALNLFLNAPAETAKEFYYTVMSGLLNLYAELINSALLLLGNSVQNIV